MLTSINPHCSDTTLHYTILHYATQHNTTLHYTTLHYTTLHYIAGHNKLHTFSQDAIPVDHTHPGRCPCRHTENKIQKVRACIWSGSLSYDFGVTAFSIYVYQIGVILDFNILIYWWWKWARSVPEFVCWAGGSLFQ